MRKKRHLETQQQIHEIAYTEALKVNAEKELEEALTIAEQLRQIREANHFTEGFRRVLGVSHGN